MSKKVLLLEYDAGHILSKDLIKNSVLTEQIKVNEELEVNGVPSIVFAVLQKYGTLNENGRIYSETILKREVDRFLKTCIPMGSSMMEANHPESTNINILNGAGLLVDCWWDGATLLGKIKLNISKGFIDSGIVSTSGDHVANLMMNGFRVGVSSRGVGSLEKKNGVNHVQDDYDLICWDFVNKPSSKGSWVADNVKKLDPYIDKTVKEQMEKKENKPLKNKLDWYLNRFN